MNQHHESKQCSFIGILMSWNIESMCVLCIGPLLALCVSTSANSRIFIGSNRALAILTKRDGLVRR